MDIKTYLSKKKTIIDKSLERLVPPARTFPAAVYEAMRYSLFAGGKRIRPILAVAAAEAVGAPAQRLVPVAGTLELIHTYSLIHDDLPAMDDDDFRRGRPTSHKVFGEAVAILAGDGLLTMAFEILSDPRLFKSIPARTLVTIIREISYASGVFGMVGGQVVDIQSEGKEIDFPTLEYIHTHKTGALIRASVRVGALYAKARQRQFEALTRYGEMIGLAFQIADDILDVTGNQVELGKDVGSDVEKGKKTFPSFLGLEESRIRANELVDKAIGVLDGFGKKADPLRELAKYIVNRVN